MPILITTIAQVTDWKRLLNLYQATLVAQATRAGASDLHVYRNVNDAAQALFILEVRDDESAREMEQFLNEKLADGPDNGFPEHRVWEPTGWLDSAGAHQ